MSEQDKTRTSFQVNDARTNGAPYPDIAFTDKQRLDLMESRCIEISWLIPNSDPPVVEIRSADNEPGEPVLQAESFCLREALDVALRASGGA